MRQRRPSSANLGESYSFRFVLLYIKYLAMLPNLSSHLYIVSRLIYVCTY